MSKLRAGRFSLDLSSTKVMGVLNCTPDSFSDGGHFFSVDAALMRAEEMIQEGVDIIDIGAESTRPGSLDVPAYEEWRRLGAVLEALVADGRVPISVDTKKSVVMAFALEKGADIINDVSGFEGINAIDVVKKSNCGLFVMHMRGSPQDMQSHTDYKDVVGEVGAYLQERVEILCASGIDKARIMVDPGFGFGKTPEQNLQLVKHIAEFVPDVPKLLGVSRKSTIGHFLNRSVSERLYGSISMAVLGAWLGASVIRTHDVRATREALEIVKVIKNSD